MVHMNSFLADFTVMSDVLLMTYYVPGFRLTADDIRKQHPRVLANELETLRLEKSRLEGQMASLEKDRHQLKHLEVRAKWGYYKF